MEEGATSIRFPMEQRVAPVSRILHFCSLAGGREYRDLDLHYTANRDKSPTLKGRMPFFPHLHREGMIALPVYGSIGKNLRNLKSQGNL